MGNLSGFVRERVASLVSKKVGASAIGVSLISGGQSEAGWAALAYAAIQGVVDAVKAIAANKQAS
jgi:subtilisin family serine protease